MSLRLLVLAVIGVLLLATPSLLLASPAGAATSPITTPSAPPIPVNRAPIARPDTVEVVTGRTVTVDPRRNDSDPDGDRLSLSAATLSPARAGSVYWSRSGLTINVAKGFLGRAVVTYRIKDSRGATASSTVTVSVTRPPNRAPVARNDARSLRPGQTATYVVLGNDSDPDGDAIRLVGVDTPRRGTARISGQRITYTANRSFTGTVAVKYTIRDSHGATDRATLTLTIRRPPPAVDTSRKSVERALARLGFPAGSVNGYYDQSTRRSMCAWRTLTGASAHRGLPTQAESRAVVSATRLPRVPRVPRSMVAGVDISRTCQAAFWVSSSGQVRRVMAASTGMSGYGTRAGTFRVFRSFTTWRRSTIYPEALMYKPMQFSGGQAMHGSITDSLVKWYPASHGCVRMLHRDIDALHRGGVGHGTRVRVFGTWRG